MNPSHSPASAQLECSDGSPDLFCRFESAYRQALRRSGDFAQSVKLLAAAPAQIDAFNDANYPGGRVSAIVRSVGN